MRKGIVASKSVATIVVITALALNFVVVTLNPTTTPILSASIDFSSDAKKIISPVWNDMNVWDVSMVESNMTEFRQQHPTVDTLTLMTATGGRNARWSYSNEYVFRHPNGTLWYNFTKLDTALDRVMAGKLKLVLVIGNVPHALANKTTFVDSDYGAFDALTLPPGNFTEYGWYIANLTAHCIDRYGIANVSQWSFRLMTEPDGRDWWSGTDDEYVELWLSTFGVIKAVAPGAKIVLGNMGEHDDFQFATHLLQSVHAINATLLPDIVSFSYYHFLQRPERPDDLETLIDRWLAHLSSLQLGKISMLGQASTVPMAGL
nr:hypothetical protein [Candidatus Sigynarchaeota archaeon]